MEIFGRKGEKKRKKSKIGWQNCNFGLGKVGNWLIAEWESCCISMLFTRFDQNIQGFPWLLETFLNHGIYFGFLNPRNSLEFCVKTLNILEICERHKK